MIDEKAINEQYRYICTLLERKSLKEAFAQINLLLWQHHDWETSNRLEQLQTSYQYMLEYMKQGVKDPERQNVYQSLMRQTWELTDQLRVAMLDNVSVRHYYETRRTLRAMETAPQDAASLLRALETFKEELATGEELGNEPGQELFMRHTDALKSLFLQTWTNSRWSAQDENDAQILLNSTQLAVEDLCLYVSAVTLSLMECFDLRKITWLLNAYRHSETEVSERALVGAIIVFHIYRYRLNLYPELQKHIEILSENSPLNRDAAIVYHQLLLCQETEKIDKKMKEEIIPEMLKNSSSMQNMIFGTDDNENEEDANDKNPDWEENLNQSALGEKLQEINDLQMEGADIYMASFAALKNYLFFQELYNWFYPFSNLQADVRKVLKEEENKPNSLLKLMLQSSLLSNSDKYSLFFTLGHIPQMQRNIMSMQFNAQREEELGELAKFTKLNDLSQRPEVVSNLYLHDLYRFFKLNKRKKEFRDIFKEKLDLHHIPVLKGILYNIETLTSIADFFFKKERWDEAAETYKELLAFKPEGKQLMICCQKLGFVLQKQRKYKEAINAYKNAETITADNVWNNRHLATCHRMNGEFDKALPYYKKLEEVLPQNTNVVYYTGICLAESERYEEALNYFFKLDFMENESIRTWRGIGWCSFVLSKHEQAMKYYKKVIENKPVAVDYLNAGHIAWSMDNVEEAATLYSKSLGLCENKKQFLELFLKDKSVLLSQGICEDDIPLMLDMLQ